MVRLLYKACVIKHINKSEIPPSAIWNEFVTEKKTHFELFFHLMFYITLKKTTDMKFNPELKLNSKRFLHS